MARVHIRVDIPADQRGRWWEVHDALAPLTAAYALNFRPDPKAANQPGGTLAMELVLSEVAPADGDDVETAVRDVLGAIYGDVPVARVE